VKFVNGIGAREYAGTGIFAEFFDSSFLAKFTGMLIDTVVARA
jgi:hypothetical protein